jgi:hypothetical protein
MLPEFTHFNFTTMETHLPLQIEQLPQKIHILPTATPFPQQDLSVTPHELPFCLDKTETCAKESL